MKICLTTGQFYVDKPNGIIKFSCRILEYGDYSLTAKLNFSYNDEYWSETIGSIDVDVPKITCSSIGKTNEYQIEVHGIAEKGCNVDIYVDDKKNTSVQANSYTGKYSVLVSLPEKASGEQYNIYAQSGANISDELTVIFEENKPAIKSVKLQFNDHNNEEIDITDVFTKGTSPVLSIVPGNKLIFEIEADHNDQIYKMYVTSTKGNSEKQIEAYWNKDKKMWITKDYFDDFNHDYIPGALNIVIEPFPIYELDEKGNYDYPVDVKNTLPEIVKDNSSYVLLSQNDNSVVEKYILSDGKNSAEITHYTEKAFTVNIDGKQISSLVIAKNPESYGYARAGFQTNENGIVDASDASLILAFYAFSQTGGDMSFSDYIKL